MNVDFGYCRGEMKEKNWDALCADMDILKNRLDAC